jgi:hypothetical protein
VTPFAASATERKLAHQPRQVDVEGLELDRGPRPGPTDVELGSSGDAPGLILGPELAQLEPPVLEIGRETEIMDVEKLVAREPIGPDAKLGIESTQ